MQFSVVKGSFFAVNVHRVTAPKESASDLTRHVWPKLIVLSYMCCAYGSYLSTLNFSLVMTAREFSLQFQFGKGCTYFLSVLSNHRIQ